MSSPKRMALALVITHDQRRPSSFLGYYDLAIYLTPLLGSGRASSTASAHENLYRAKNAYMVAEGTLAAKEAAARRVLEDAASDACLPS